MWKEEKQDEHEGQGGKENEEYQGGGEHGGAAVAAV